MPIQGRYIGRDSVCLRHNEVYLIDMRQRERGNSWVVTVYDTSLVGLIIKLFTGHYKEKTRITYLRYPSKYWVINANTNYELLRMAGIFQPVKTRPLLPIFCPRGCM